MSNSNYSANSDSFDDALVTVAAGFEVAVAEYGYSWAAYQTSKSTLNDCHMAVDIAYIRFEEAATSVDEIATEFSAANPHDDNFDDLLWMLDVARDHLIATSDDYNFANAQLLSADAQFDAQRASIDEAFEIARSFRSELDYITQIDNETLAANEDQFEPSVELDLLSESAKHFYRHAA